MRAVARLQITAREVILVTLVALALIRGCAAVDEPSAGVSLGAVTPTELPR